MTHRTSRPPGSHPAVKLRVVAQRERRNCWGRGFLTALIALPLAAGSAVFFWGRPPAAMAARLYALAPAGLGGEGDHFARCAGPVRVTCVIDGDTIWYHGTKIRIADINAPEVSEPDCEAEADLGRRATDRLIALLNQGKFTLERVDRDEDRYGRKLRTIVRHGQSVGGELVREGLAEKWTGHRRYWC